MLEDVVYHDPQFLVASRLLVQNDVRLIQCESVADECRLSHLPLLQLLEDTFIQIITMGYTFLPKPD